MYSVQYLWNNSKDNINIVYKWVFAERARPCTAHTSLFRLFNILTGALRAPAPPIAASLILQAKVMIFRENPRKIPLLK
jgi:hypothetical protein